MLAKKNGSHKILSTSNLDSIDITNQEILYSAVTTELIEDDALKSLINDQGEIQVSNKIYKISPFGTFYAEARNEDELEKVFEKMAVLNDITVRILEPESELNFNDIVKQETDKPGVYLLNGKVNFIDTFKETPDISSEINEENNVNDTNNIATHNSIKILSQSNASRPVRDPTVPRDPNAPITPRPIRPIIPANELPFVNMDTYSINFRDGAGSVWDTYFYNQTKYNYFNGEYRVSVLFYNRNYALFKTLGVKVKLQKQGWFWWNKTNAEEIITGWDRMVYKQVNTQPAFTRPTNSIPLNMNPNIVYINPFAEKPAYGYFTNNKISLYKWNFGRANSELFSLMIPYYLVPGTTDDITVSSSAFKPLVTQGWDWLKQRLVNSVPAPAPLTVAADPYNYKFPIFDLNNGKQSFLSINDMENMPKAFNSETNKVYNVIAGQKIRTYISPYLSRVQNTDMIDIPLDFSTATISLSQNFSSPISISNTLNSLNISNLESSYKVEQADIFGTVKHNGQWLGIRLIVKL